MIYLSFSFVMLIIGPSFCAIECVRQAETSLETLFLTSTTSRSQRENDWFSTDYDGQQEICIELERKVYNDNLTFRGIYQMETPVTIHGTLTNPRRNYRCFFFNGEFRVFPIPKTNTIFVSKGQPTEVQLETDEDETVTVSKLDYCFQLAPLYSISEGVLQSKYSKNGIPKDYELSRTHSISNNTPNPFNTLLPQERYALCSLIFQAKYFSNTGIDLRVSPSKIVRYRTNTKFDKMTGESMGYISFEDPRKPGRFPVPPKYFGPEKVIWCDATNGKQYYIIWAYNALAVYVMEKVSTYTFPSRNGETTVPFPLYKNLTQIDGIATLDKLNNEMFF